MVSAMIAQPCVWLKTLAFSFIPGLNRAASMMWKSSWTKGGSHNIRPHGVARRSRTDSINRSARSPLRYPLSTAQDCGFRKILPSGFWSEPNLRPSAE